MRLHFCTVRYTKLSLSRLCSERILFFFLSSWRRGIVFSLLHKLIQPSSSLGYAQVTVMLEACRVFVVMLKPAVKV